MKVIGWVVGLPLVLSVGTALVSLCAMAVLAEFQQAQFPPEDGVMAKVAMDVCPSCEGDLDTGYECQSCGRDWIQYAQI